MVAPAEKETVPESERKAPINNAIRRKAEEARRKVEAVSQKTEINVVDKLKEALREVDEELSRENELKRQCALETTQELKTRLQAEAAPQQAQKQAETIIQNPPTNTMEDLRHKRGATAQITKVPHPDKTKIIQEFKETRRRAMSEAVKTPEDDFESARKEWETTRNEIQTFQVEQSRLEKLKRLVRVSRTLKVSQMAQILDLSEKELYDRILDWAEKFGFVLDQDVVDFTAGSKDDFIAELDAAFATWGTQGKI